MLFQIFSFVLDIAAGLLGGACLLRLYMQHQRLPFGNAIGRFVFALTDWIVLPLRRIVRPVGRWDLASLVAAYAVELTQYLLLWLALGAGAGIGVVPLLAVFGLARLVLSSLIALLIVYAVLSWVQPGSHLMGLLDRLAAPFLRPIQRVLPRLGGVDLSPLVLLVLLHIAMIVLGHLQATVMGASV